MKTISFINMKGGVAKTTLAINIADYLARRHSKKVLLIDVDPQFNATQCLMNPVAYINHLNAEKDTILTVFDRQPRAIASTVQGQTTQQPKSLETIDTVSISSKYHLLPGNLELYRLEMAPGRGT